MGLFDALKTAATIAKESGKLELQGEILGIHEKLLEQQKKISDLEADNKELKEKLKTKGNLKPEKNAYWIMNEEKKDGPFCTGCWDSETLLMRLHSSVNDSLSYTCPKCKNYIRTAPFIDYNSGQTDQNFFI